VDSKDGVQCRAWPAHADSALAALLTPIRDWFVFEFGAPTAVQRLAWLRVAAGNNLLLAAPTGTGKTLAAFLPIIGRLMNDAPVESVRCLYIAPLKALINDALRNLHTHLEGIRSFLPAGSYLPRLGFRTGDTAAHRRRSLFERPPDILLTTPESLAVILSRPGAGAMFDGLQAVVVDEVHALASNKRGADLALSLERLEELTGRSVQRIGLSASCHPPAEAARFLVGAERPCFVATVEDLAALHLTVELLGQEAAEGFVAALVDRLAPVLSANRSTLIFTNTRALAERLSWAIRQRFPEWDEQVAAHHGALAPERRRVVEARLKDGSLRAVVSSTSLELGIDIGTVDAVVLVHPPGDVVRLLQRVGRSGHGPGRPRRGLILAETPAELLEAAVTVAGGRAGQVDRLSVPASPLDVLCQHLVGMGSAKTWKTEVAFRLARRAYPFRSLSRGDFDDCLAYLCGQRRDGGFWLPARLRREGDSFRVRDERTARLLRRNLGTILAEEACSIRLNESRRQTGKRTVIGQVDESFAHLLRPGDRFLLDGRCLEHQRVEAHDLLVTEVAGRPITPRWGGAGWPLSAELARRLFQLRTRAVDALLEGTGALIDLLRSDYGMDESAARVLAEYFERQECLSEIPQETTLLIETVPSEVGLASFVHTPLNRRGNAALAQVVALRLAREYDRPSRSCVADLGFVLQLDNHDLLHQDAWRCLLRADRFEDDLKASLEKSELLRHRFQRVAQTGLMLLRNPLGRRHAGGRSWRERMLFDRVQASEPGFVLLRLAVREVCTELCDARVAHSFVSELPRREIHHRVLYQVSPFAQHWTQVADGPEQIVDTPAQALARLHATLMAAGGR
jgi:ATP-dependent helicase Lhr and Lhr-like helicase